MTASGRLGRLYKRFTYLLYTKRCAFCGRPVPVHKDTCSVCEVSLARPVNPRCRLCGNGKKYCTCRKRAKYYDELVSPFYYEGAAKTGIGRMKFRNKPQCSQHLGEEMAREIKENYCVDSFDFVTCIPMTKKELKTRGYNQSELLAKKISEEIGVPFDGGVLTKLYDTKAQRTLGRVGRNGNIFGVFDSRDVTGKSVLLCDDIRTTGATLNECAKMLSLSGAWSIVCVTAAVSREKKTEKKTI